MEDDKKQFKQNLEAELTSYVNRSVIDLTEREAAKELLIRFYLMGCKFESVGGKMSRVAWMEMPKPSKQNNWQDEAKHRNDAIHGEAEREPKVHVDKLHEDDEYDAVKDLMKRAGMKIDATILNRDKALRMRADGMNELRYQDSFLDRAHSTGLVKKLIVDDLLLKRAMENVVQMRQAHKDVLQEWQDWRVEDVAKSKIMKAILIVPRHRRRKRFETDERMAKMDLYQAETTYKDAQCKLGEDLDVAYSQDVYGKHYHLRFGVARRQRMEDFYKKFFGRVWPYDASSGQARTDDKGALNSRQAELERISQLMACLGMEA